MPVQDLASISQNKSLQKAEKLLFMSCFSVTTFTVPLILICFSFASLSVGTFSPLPLPFQCAVAS